MKSLPQPGLEPHQAEWTRPMRRELYRRVRLAGRERALDVGCGDGLITEELAAICRGRVVGADSDEAMIRAARKRGGRAEYVVADAGALSFPDGAFDLVVCHWLLLWLPDPARALGEFRRLLRPGGLVLAAGEPDYGGRIVHPPEAELKDDLIAAFRAQGADPLIGRKLPALFGQAGFTVQCGLYPGLWTGEVEEARVAGEERFLRTVLQNRLELTALEPAIAAMRRARERGALLISTPVFWAIAAAKSS